MVLVLEKGRMMVGLGRESGRSLRPLEDWLAEEEEEVSSIGEDSSLSSLELHTHSCLMATLRCFVIAGR